MKHQQLLFFEEDKTEQLQREVEKLRDQCEKIRKGQYAKISQLHKMYLETQHELEMLKRGICKNTSWNLHKNEVMHVICS